MVTRYELPSTKHSVPSGRVFVDLETEVKIGEALEYGTFLAASQSNALVAKKIRYWNLTDDSGKALPITEENVMRFPSLDLHYLRGRLQFDHGLSLEQQKDVVRYAGLLRDGQSTDGVEPPLAYILYLYRKRFHLSYREAAQTPLHVIQQDLLFAEYEGPSNPSNQ